MKIKFIDLKLAFAYCDWHVIILYLGCDNLIQIDILKIKTMDLNPNRKIVLIKNILLVGDSVVNFDYIYFVRQARNTGNEDSSDLYGIIPNHGAPPLPGLFFNKFQMSKFGFSILQYCSSERNLSLMIKHLLQIYTSIKLCLLMTPS